MKLKIPLILLSLLFAKVSIGQEITKADIIKFKINAITTIDDEGNIENIKFYNQKGDFVKEGSLNDRKQIQIDRELYYNNSSQLIQEQTYNYNGEIHRISKYFYNDKNQLFKKELILDNDVNTTWELKYDEKGNKISETQKSGTMENSITSYKYNDKNFLIQEDKSNNLIGKENRVNYKYNDIGLLIEKKTLVYYFNTTITLKYIYNDAGKLIKLLEKSSNGVSLTTIFLYNKKGLLISTTRESSISKIPFNTSYVIDYE